MAIEVGTHLNGDRYAKVWLSDRGISATIEGTGPNDDIATMKLEMRLRQLAELAEEAAESMAIDASHGDSP